MLFYQRGSEVPAALELSGTMRAVSEPSLDAALPLGKRTVRKANISGIFTRSARALSSKMFSCYMTMSSNQMKSQLGGGESGPETSPEKVKMVLSQKKSKKPTPEKKEKRSKKSTTIIKGTTSRKQDDVGDVCVFDGPPTLSYVRKRRSMDVYRKRSAARRNGRSSPGKASLCGSLANLR